MTHENSIQAYIDLLPKLPKKRKETLEIMVSLHKNNIPAYGKTLFEAGVSTAANNATRLAKDLCDAGLAKEVGSIRNTSTGKLNTMYEPTYATEVIKTSRAAKDPARMRYYAAVTTRDGNISLHGPMHKADAEAQVENHKKLTLVISARLMKRGGGHVIKEVA